VLPDAAHPDDGSATTARWAYPLLRRFWNAWVTEHGRSTRCPTWPGLRFDGDERYAEGRFFLDALAGIYPESTAGSWITQFSPSGRFADRGISGRNLVVYVEAYDLIYSSPVLDQLRCVPG